MKRFSQRSGHHTMAELNITPLLDLAFVLLIIFIITTPLLEQSIPLNLPTASPQVTKPDPGSIRTVAVDNDGIIYLGTRAVSRAELDAELVRWRAADPGTAVVLRADRDIRYQKLIDVFDALQRANITKVGLLNTPDEKPKPGSRR